MTRREYGSGSVYRRASDGRWMGTYEDRCIVRPAPEPESIYPGGMARDPLLEDGIA